MESRTYEEAEPREHETINGYTVSTIEAASHVDTQLPPPPMSQGRITKNIFLISLSFLFNFNAYQGLARLQSSLHQDEGMGVINQSILYACLMISCFFLPTLVISAIGHKWTMPLSMIGYILWMAANGVGTWGTMVPASILVGICAAPLWTAQCSYFTLIGGRYAKRSGESEEAVVSRFFGIFFMFFQLSSITGSIISSTILRPTVNGTEEVDPDDLKYCGGEFCPDNNYTNPNLEDPDDTLVWTMVGVYMAIAACAIVILCLFVDPLPKDLLPEKANIKEEICGLMVATGVHLKKSWQLLLIPITMYSGFEQAFYNAEFTQSFVSCSQGIWSVGLVTLPFGVVNATVSFFGGHVVKYVGRAPVFIAGLIVDLAIQITIMIWLPDDPDEVYVLYILAGMWGFTDGIWQTQINALYGCIFSTTSEAAFSNYRMWESLGFIIAFAYSNFLCTKVKTYILTGVLCVGIACYGIVETQVQKNGPDRSFQMNEKPSTEAGSQQKQAEGSFTMIPQW